MEKTAFKSIHNRRRYPSSYCYGIDENKRFKIWRSTVAPSDATEKSNIDAQLQSLTCIIALKMFWKIYFLYDFWCTKKLCSEPFLEYPYEPWHLLSALYSDVRKEIYRCTSTFSAVRYCSRILFKSVCYLYEVVHTTFSSISGVFAIFDRNFVKIVTPQQSKWELALLLKKGEKSIKSTH